MLLINFIHDINVLLQIPYTVKRNLKTVPSGECNSTFMSLIKLINNMHLKLGFDLG